MKTIRQILAEVEITEPRERPEEPEFPFEGQCDFQGIKIDIENKVGSKRSGTDPSGKEWEVTMSAHYGEIRNTEGADGDKLDVYVGPDENSQWVYVVHQVHPEDSPKAGKFDEDKVMLGYENPNDAVRAYLSHYDCPSFFGSMSMMPLERFKAWLRKPDAKGEAAQPPVHWKPRGKTEHPGAPV